MRRWNRWIVMLLIAVPLRSQVLEIVVRDAEAQWPVPGAVCLADSVVLGVTNAQGKLQVVYQGQQPFQLTVYKLGYRRWQEEIFVRQDTVQIAVALVLQPLLFEKVIVSSYRSEQEHYASNLLSIGPQSIDQYLDFLPHIAIQRRAAMAGEPIVQGMGLQRYEFHIDGVPVLPACTDHMDPVNTYIEPEALRNAAVLFSQASGGFATVEFQSDPPRFGPTQFSALVKAGYHSINRGIRTYVRAHWQSASVGILGDIVYRTAQDYYAGGQQRITPSGLRKWNYRVQGIAQLSPALQVTGTFIGDDGYDIGFAALPMDTRYDRLRLGTVQLQWRVNQQHVRTLAIQLFGSKVDHYMDDWKRPVPLHMDMPGHTWTLGGRVVARGRIGAVPVNLWGEYRREGMHAEMVMYAPDAPPMWMPTWPAMHRDRWSVRAQVALPFSWGAIVPYGAVVGAKTQLLQSREIAVLQGLVGIFAPQRQDVAWNVGAKVDVTTTSPFHFSIALSQQQRLLHQSELYGFYLFQSQDGYDYIGNPKLKPEQRFALQMQFAYERAQSGVFVEMYYNRFRNYVAARNVHIPSMTVGAKGVKQYSNYTAAWNIGFNAAGWWEPFPTVVGMVIVKASTGRRADGLLLPAMMPWNFHAFLRYRPAQWWIALSCEGALANRSVATWAGETPDPGYTIWGLQVGWQVQQVVTVRIGVENIFDVRYHRFSDWNDLPAPGRNFYLSLQGEFGGK